MDVINSNIARAHGVVLSMQGGRPENQDDYAALDTPLGLLVIICDGMGGGPGGKTASFIAKNVIARTIYECGPNAKRDYAFRLAAEKAHEALLQQMQLMPNLNGMGSTFVAALISPHSIVVAHCGDSRCYLLRGKKIAYRSEDHSLVNDLVKNKTLTREQARLSPQSNIITRGLGNTSCQVPEIDEIPYRKGDRLVLCTDGVWGVMPEEDLIKRLTRKVDLTTLINNLAYQIDQIGPQSKDGHHDNHTQAILLMDDNSELKPKALVPWLRFYLFIMLFLGIATGEAQTVVWQLPLSNYDEITRIYPNLYRVSRNGKIGLINADGTVVAPIEIDAIGDFYEHKALATASDGQGERVMGVLTDDGHYYGFSNKYYTLKGLKFYSDYVLPVSDANGALGYIDIHGNAVTGFAEKYTKIKPFAEGYAVVFKGNDFSLIDKSGVPVKFKFKNVAEAYGATNVFEGKAYVWDTNGKFYTYDTNSGDYCEKAKEPKNASQLDYLYRCSSVSGLGKDVPFVKAAIESSADKMPIEERGLYGYTFGSQVVLPAQLQSATGFDEDCAVVGMNGKLGILKYVDGASFALRQNETEPRNFYDGDAMDCSFALSVPTAWQSKGVEVVIRDANGTSPALSQDGATYKFTLSPTETSTSDYALTVMGDGLKLYQDKLSYSFVKKFKCPICGRDTDVCPGHPVETDQPQQEELCPTCGKPINECKFQGEH